MSFDNRIISSQPYIINTINTDNNISKRTNNKSLLSRNKKQNSHDEFEKTLSSIPNSSKTEDNFEEDSEFKNQLYNLSLAKNKNIITKSNSDKSTADNTEESPSDDPSTKVVNSELHAKISQAMTMEVDVSTLYEKIKLLNSLKK